MKVTDEAAKKLPHQVVIKMQSIYDSLKSVERRVADLILVNPQIISSSAISVVAKRADCSDATLVRFARKLGYTGYAQLKKELSNAECMTANNLYQNFNKSDILQMTTRQVFLSSIQAIEDTLNILDFKDYKFVLECMRKCRRIAFFGVGDASIVALAAYHKFMRIGYDCQEASDADTQIIIAAHLQEGDIAFIISHSGRSRAVINAAKQAKRSGATVISITNYCNSLLTKNSDVSILTAAFAEPIIGEIVSKRVAELCIIESLYINLVLNDERLIHEILLSNNSIIAVNKL